MSINQFCLFFAFFATRHVQSNKKPTGRYFDRFDSGGNINAHQPQPLDEMNVHTFKTNIYCDE